MVNLSKTLTGLAVLVSAAGCVPRAEQREEQIEQEIPYQAPSTPPVYARQDYGMGWDKEVALYNIDQILKDPRVCSGGGGADYRDFNCEHIILWVQMSGSEFLSQHSFMLSVADSNDGPNCLNIVYYYPRKNRSEYFPICANDSQQKEDLKKAVEIYLRECLVS